MGLKVLGAREQGGLGLREKRGLRGGLEERAWRRGLGGEGFRRVPAEKDWEGRGGEDGIAGLGFGRG